MQLHACNLLDMHAQAQHGDAQKPIHGIASQKRQASLQKLPQSSRRRRGALLAARGACCVLWIVAVYARQTLVGMSHRARLTTLLVPVRLIVRAQRPTLCPSGAHSGQLTILSAACLSMGWLLTACDVAFWRTLQCM